MKHGLGRLRAHQSKPELPNPHDYFTPPAFPIINLIGSSKGCVACLNHPLNILPKKAHTADKKRHVIEGWAKAVA